MPFQIPLNRLEPKMPPQNYKTYSVRAPLGTHWRKATCEEVECDGFLYGFVTTVDVGTELGQRQYHFLTHDKRRKHSMQNVGNGLFKFVYGPGNICMNYQEHRAPIGKPPLLLVAAGDWRGNPMRIPTTRHNSIENWVEDLGLHQDRIKSIVEKG